MGTPCLSASCDERCAIQTPTSEADNLEPPDSSVYICEDADDLIGPDGYTEQLPPYTRYANGIPPKGEYAVPDANPDIPPYIQQRNSLLAPMIQQSHNDTYTPPISQSSTLNNPFDDRHASLLSPPETESPPREPSPSKEAAETPMGFCDAFSRDMAEG